MKVIVIDVINKTVYEKRIDGELPTMQGIVGGYIEKATELPNGDTVYVNEEGMLTNPLPDHWFTVDGAHQPFAGMGFVTGFDEKTGDTVDVKSTLSEIAAMVKFYDLDGVRVLLNIPGGVR